MHCIISAIPSEIAPYLGFYCMDPYGNQFVDEQDNCANVTCFNGGVCRETHLSFECVCPDLFTGDTCETDSYLASFEIEEAFNDALTNTSSEEYISLLNATITGIQDFCSDTSTSVEICSVSDVTFTSVRGGQLIGVDFTFTTGSVHVDEETIFNELVSLVMNDPMSLVENKKVWLSSIAFGTYEQEYCPEQGCQNNGTCEETELSFRCICLENFIGSQCQTEIITYEGSFVIDSVWGSDLSLTQSTAFGELSSAVQTALDEICSDELSVSSCDVDEIIFTESTDGKISVAFSFTVVASITSGQITSLFNEFVSKSATGVGGVIPGYTVIASSWVLADNVQDYCDPNPCGDNGNCTELATSFECVCEDGFFGSLCDSDQDYCAGVTCENGGTCQILSDGFECQCLEGYTGDNCETDIDFCAGDNPCQNGGTCTDGLTSFTCTCPRTFTGSVCSVERLLLPYGADAGDTNPTLVRERLGTFASGEIPLPDVLIGSHSYSRFYISACGYVGFGNQFFRQTPTEWDNAIDSAMSDNLAILAPHWTSCAYDSGDTPVYYHVYQRQSSSSPTYDSVQEIFDLAQTRLSESGRMGFNATVLLVVTFTNTLPDEQYDPTLDQGNTFQVVLLADPANARASVVYLYETMGWRSTGFIREALIGYYFGSSDQFQHQFSSFPSTTNPGSSNAFRLDIISLYDASANVRVGLYAYDVTITAAVTNDIQCDAWYESEKDNAPDTLWSLALQFFGFTVDGPASYFDWGDEFNVFPQCPCDLFQMNARSVRGRWIRWAPLDLTDIRTCYISRGSFFGTKTCCYSTNSETLLLFSKYTGTYSVYHPLFQPNLYDSFDRPYFDLCCGDGATTCDNYLELRPQDHTCLNIRPRFFWAFGDPHFITLDGFQYTFNGLAEYILVDTDVTEPTANEQGFTNPSVSASKKTTIHMRTIQARDMEGNDQSATIFGAYVIKVTDAPEIYVGMNEQRTAFDIRVCGGTFDYNTWFSTAADGDHLPMDHAVTGADISKVMDNQISVFYEQGPEFLVSIQQGQLGHGLTLSDNLYAGVTSGLLGNNNGDSTDDLIPNGGSQPLSANSDDRTIHTQFGETWKLESSAASLFSCFYTATETFESFNTNPNYSPVYYDELLAAEEAAGLNDATRLADLNQAKADCTPTGASSWSKTCLFDWLVTRNSAAAAISLTSEEDATAENANLNNQRPTVTAPMVVNATYNQAVSFTVTATDPDAGDTLTVTVMGIAEAEYNYVQSTGIFTWTPTYTTASATTPTLMFTAEDSQEGMSPTVTVKIRYCYCLNTGSCDDFGVLQEGQSAEDNFALVQCVCETGWTGSDCSLNFDGCQTEPCVASACTDLLPAQTTATTSFTCGPCGDGYEKIDGADSNCQDDDECTVNGGQGDCLAPATCVNTIGSFHCQCPNGFRLANDGVTCNNIDECEEETDTCDQICIDSTPTNGQPLFSCSCHSGYDIQQDETSCVQNQAAAAECPGDPPCSQLCGLATGGGRECFCDPGYRLEGDGVTCTDINECTEMTDDCDANGQCNDTDGGYICVCNTGYTLADDQRTCVVCEAGTWGDNCQNTCNCLDASTTCDPVTGCVTCAAGFEPPGACDQEINECDPNPCGAFTSGCVDGLATFECNCQDGYERATQTTCSEINECLSTPCQNGGECVNEVNAYSCNCAAGYTGDNCETDIDECDSSPCMNSGTCQDAVNAYLCQCTDAWQGAFCETPVIPQEENEFDGAFTIEATFSADLTDTTTSAYIQLAEAVRIGVASACTDALETGICEVYAISFSDAGGVISTSYKLNITDRITATLDESHVFTMLVSRAEGGTLLANQNTRSSTVVLGDFIQNYCQPDPCTNSGVCSQTANGFNCACSPEWTGDICELRNLDGNFTLDQDFIEAYNDTTSTTYTALRDQIISGVEGALNNAVSGANSDIYSISLSADSDNKVVVSYKVSTASTVTDADVATMFNALVAKATDDTLIPTIVVIASSISFGENEQNYCVENPPSCANSGVCAEEAEGFTCTCAERYSGATCELRVLEGSFVIGQSFDAVLAFMTSQQYVTLSAAVIAGVEDVCVLQSCDVRDVIFMNDNMTSLTGVTYQMDLPDTITSTLIEGIFDEIVDRAEDGTLLDSYDVRANTVTLDTFEQNYCDGVTCNNNGVCIETATSYQCQCSGLFTGQNCETALQDVPGSFVLTSAFDSNLEDTASTQYTTLSAAVKTGVEAVCNVAVATASCDVHSITFANTTDEQTSVSFTVTMLDSITDAQIITIFNAMVTAAEGGADGLVTGSTAIASGLKLGSNTQNYCSGVTCSGNGNCVQTATGYECQCTSLFQGVNCETALQNVAGSFKLTDVYSASLGDTTSSQYMTLSAAVETGVETVCNGAVATANCDVSSVTFADDSGQTSVTFTIRMLGSITNAQITTIFEAMVTAAEGGADGLVTGSTAIASGLTLGSNMKSYCGEVTCANGGTCVENDYSFTCTCPTGFNGSLCDNNIDYCMPNPCMNGGSCSEVDNAFSCSCGIYSGPTCELFLERVSSELVLPDEVYTDDLADTSSPAYISLRDKILTVRLRCDVTVSFIGQNIDCVIENVTFRQGSVIANYTISITFPASLQPQSEQLIEDLFDNIVQAAENNNLIDGVTVDPNTIEVGTHTTFCMNNPCLNGGTCTELDDGFSCACASSYSGNTCNEYVRRVPSELILPDETFTSDLNDASTTAYMELRDKIRTIRTRCDATPSFVENGNIACDIENVVFTSGSIQVNYEFVITFPANLSSQADDYIEDLFNNILIAARSNDLLADLTVDPAAIIVEPHTSFCTDDRCSNGGNCTDSSEGFSCSCVAPYSGDTCNKFVVRYDSELTLPDEVFTSALNDATSSEYITLSDKIATITTKCSSTRSFIDQNIDCAVESVEFSSGSVEVDFTFVITFPDSLRNDADDLIEDLFDNIVEAARDGSLFTGLNVDPDSIVIGRHRTPDEEDDGLGTGAIIGIAVGVPIFVVLLVLMVCGFLYMKARLAGSRRRPGKGLYRDEIPSSESSIGDRYFGRRPMLLWQSGKFGGMSESSYRLDDERSGYSRRSRRRYPKYPVEGPMLRNGDRVVGIEVFGKDGKHEYRDLDRPRSEYSRRSRHHRRRDDDRYTYVTSEYSSSSGKSGRTRDYYRTYDNYYPRRYYDYYNQYRHGNHNYDQGRLRNITYALDATKPIDWSAMRNFSKKKDYGGQLWRSNRSSRASSWNWDAW